MRLSLECGCSLFSRNRDRFLQSEIRFDRYGMTRESADCELSRT